MKAVFNSSPIIFLTKLGIIEAASDLFDRIDIPSLVYSEIRRKPDASAEAVEGLIKGKPVSVSKAKNERFKLQGVGPNQLVDISQKTE
jgi:hypothetical protein